MTTDATSAKAQAITYITAELGKAKQDLAASEKQISDRKSEISKIDGRINISKEQLKSIDEYNAARDGVSHYSGINDNYDGRDDDDGDMHSRSGRDIDDGRGMGHRSHDDDRIAEMIRERMRIDEQYRAQQLKKCQKDESKVIDLNEKVKQLGNVRVVLG